MVQHCQHRTAAQRTRDASLMSTMWKRRS